MTIHQSPAEESNEDSDEDGDEDSSYKEVSRALEDSVTEAFMNEHGRSGNKRGSKFELVVTFPGSNKETRVRIPSGPFSKYWPTELKMLLVEIEKYVSSCCSHTCLRFCLRSHCLLTVFP